MARQMRIVYPGAYYHVMARGNQRQPIVRGEDDCTLMLETWAEAVEKTGWQVLAFTLMNNHYHAVLQTPEPNLVEGMKWLQNAYTRRFARRHQHWGRLFGDRYKAIVIDPEEDQPAGQYLPAVLDYVHLNPVRAGLVAPGQGLGLLDYPWSSLALGYGRPAKQRASWLAVASGLQLSGLNDTTAGRREYLRRLEERAAAEEQNTCGLSLPEGQSLRSTLRRGWYWGRQSFGEALAKSLSTPRNRTYRSSPVAQAKERQQAEELLQEGLAHFQINDQPANRQNNPARVAIAWALTRRTSVPQSWIADQLTLHSPANVSQLSRRFAQDLSLHPPQVQRWIKRVKIC